MYPINIPPFVMVSCMVYRISTWKCREQIDLDIIITWIISWWFPFSLLLHVYAPGRAESIMEGCLVGEKIASAVVPPVILLVILLSGVCSKHFQLSCQLLFSFELFCTLLATERFLLPTNVSRTLYVFWSPQTFILNKFTQIWIFNNTFLLSLLKFSVVLVCLWPWRTLITFRVSLISLCHAISS